MIDLVRYRMARAALNWTSRQVAAASGLTIASINALQAGGTISADEWRKLQQAFEAASVVFPNCHDGIVVKLRKQDALVKSPLSEPSGPASDVVKAMDAAIKEHHRKTRP